MPSTFPTTCMSPAFIPVRKRQSLGGLPTPLLAIGIVEQGTGIAESLEKVFLQARVGIAFLPGMVRGSGVISGLS